MPDIIKLIMFLALLIGMIVATLQRDALKQQAVDRGFAEWRIVSRYKKVEFKWKDEK
jgi:hypothetical protein